MTRRTPAPEPGRLPDGRPDPAPDVYAVEHDGPTFRVRHYPDAGARRPCCTILVTRRDGESTGDALHRAYLLSARQHP